ncbi:MAG: DinB family protein [Planctomycetota bacterium]
MMAESLITLAKPSLGMGAGLLAGIPEDLFARFAEGRDGRLQANHPAWIIGHLAIYPHAALSLLGDDPAAHDGAASDLWQSLFSRTSTCEDDPAGTRYPPKDELVAAWTGETTRLMERLVGVSDEALSAPQPVERWKERMPRVYDSFAFLVGAHAMFHLGQLSTWRRVAGLGRAG